MTTIFADVIADSVNPEGVRLTTLHAHYPLVIHAEVLTHRQWSRNARSSRAVPIKRMIQDCIDDPFVPLHWGKAQAGMQAHEEHNNTVLGYGPYGMDGYRVDRETAWLQACQDAIRAAQNFADAGFHKQVANRLLAPFLHIDTLITATDFTNFLALRDHEDAEPHIAILARAIRGALDDSTPKPLQPGQWHLPYVDHTFVCWNSDDERWEQDCGGHDHDRVCYYLSDQKRGGSYQDVVDHLKLVSASRCARVSYQPFAGSSDVIRDIGLAERLRASRHMSPFEHIAMPDRLIDKTALRPEYRRADLSGNFRPGWVQFRKEIEQET